MSKVNHFRIQLTTVMRFSTAEIEMVGGVPQITWLPNLNTNGVVRSYTIRGKTNLTDEADWECPNRMPPIGSSR